MWQTVRRLDGEEKYRPHTHYYAEATKDKIANRPKYNHIQTAYYFIS